MRTKFINCLSLQANLAGSKSDKEETKGKNREEKELLYRKRLTDNSITGPCILLKCTKISITVYMYMYYTLL